MTRVIVVGAGVVGLSCAVRLLEAGHRVDVLARDLPLETTVAVAAAIWYPYRALPQDRVTGWSGASYAEFVGLAGEPDTGVRMLTGTEVLRRADRRIPWWRAAVPALDRETALPPGYGDGWTFVDAGGRDAGLPALADRPGRGARRHDHPDEPPGAAAGRTLVVNCAGLGARLLAGDRTVVPVRGQVLAVEQVGLERWWLDRAGPTYVVPRSRDIVVGGTDDEGDWSRTPVAGDGAGDPGRGPPGWCPSSRARGCCGTRSGCGRCGPPSALERVGVRGALLRPRRRRRDAVAGACADEVVGLVVG